MSKNTTGAKNFSKLLLSEVDKVTNIADQILNDITLAYQVFNPHVNGYYYVDMVHGPWVDLYKSYITSPTDEIFTNASDSVSNFPKHLGSVATDIDIPQLNIEYDTITGKSRNINYASRLNFTGDFNINYLDTYDLKLFRYHENWQRFIELYKRGSIKSTLPQDTSNLLTSEFIDIDYFNAIYILIFDPFTVNVRGIIKIMGVSPINLPIKQILGDRSKGQLTTINQNYKSNDVIFEFYDKAIVLYSSKLYTFPKSNNTESFNTSTIPQNSLIKEYIDYRSKIN